MLPEKLTVCDACAIKSCESPYSDGECWNNPSEAVLGEGNVLIRVAKTPGHQPEISATQSP